MGEWDWKTVAQLAVFAFGAGGVVQQLRNLNSNDPSTADHAKMALNG